jgi:hypothetical protein
VSDVLAQVSPCQSHLLEWYMHGRREPAGREQLQARLKTLRNECERGQVEHETG